MKKLHVLLAMMAVVVLAGCGQKAPMDNADMVDATVDMEATTGTNDMEAADDMMADEAVADDMMADEAMEETTTGENVDDAVAEIEGMLEASVEAN